MLDRGTIGEAKHSKGKPGPIYRHCPNLSLNCRNASRSQERKGERLKEKIRCRGVGGTLGVTKARLGNSPASTGSLGEVDGIQAIISRNEKGTAGPLQRGEKGETLRRVRAREKPWESGRGKKEQEGTEKVVTTLETKTESSTT